MDIEFINVLDRPIAHIPLVEIDILFEMVMPIVRLGSVLDDQRFECLAYRLAGEPPVLLELLGRGLDYGRLDVRSDLDRNNLGEQPAENLRIVPADLDQ